MSAGAGMSRPYIPPPKDRPAVPPKPPDNPSLRWRLRRWILKKLDAWPREKPEPTTEWGRMRRAERRRLVEEVERLRALEAKLEEWWPALVEGARAEIDGGSPS